MRSLLVDVLDLACSEVGPPGRARLLRRDSILGGDSAIETQEVSGAPDKDQGVLGISASWIGWTQRSWSMS
jgi:hypothetical protein